MHYYQKHHLTIAEFSQVLLLWSLNLAERSPRRWSKKGMATVFLKYTSIEVDSGFVRWCCCLLIRGIDTVIQKNFAWLLLIWVNPWKGGCTCTPLGYRPGSVMIFEKNSASHSEQINLWNRSESISLIFIWYEAYLIHIGKSSI